MIVCLNARRLRQSLVAMVGMLLLQACQAPSTAGPAGGKTAVVPAASVQRDGTYIDPESSLLFPVFLGAFQRTDIRNHSKEGDALSVSYWRKAPETRATIIIYPAPWRGDAPATALSGRQFSGACRPEFERIKQQVAADYSAARYIDERGSINVTGNRYTGSTRLIYEVGPNDGKPKTNLYVYVTCLGERGWIIRSDLQAPGSVDLQAAFHELRDGLISHSPSVRGYGWDGAPNTI